MQYVTYIPPIRLDMLVAKFSRTLQSLVAKQFFEEQVDTTLHLMKSSERITIPIRRLQHLCFGAFESCLKELQSYIQQCN